MADNQNKGGLNFETVASIVAMIVGAVAVFIAWDQAQVMRDQQHASVWPIVTSDFDISGGDEFLALTLKVSNRGVGPAIIESARIMAGEESVPSLSSMLATFFGDAPMPEIMDLGGATLETSVLGAGESIDVLSIYWPRDEQSDAAFSLLAERLYSGKVSGLVVESCYCSVFERCFESSGNGLPREVKQCLAQAEMFEVFQVNE